MFLGHYGLAFAAKRAAPRTGKRFRRVFNRVILRYFRSDSSEMDPQLSRSRVCGAIDLARLLAASETGGAQGCERNPGESARRRGNTT